MAALELVVVELMAKHTANRLTGLVEMVRGLANPKSEGLGEEEEEEEEDLFVFNDTIEGPRAPAVKPGRITQA